MMSLPKCLLLDIRFIPILTALTLSGCQSVSHQPVSEDKRFNHLCIEREIASVCDAYLKKKVNTLLLSLTPATQDDGPLISTKGVVDRHDGEILLWLPLSRTLVVRVNQAGLKALVYSSFVEEISLDTERH